MPGNLQAIVIGKTPQRIQTWLAPNESFLLVNNDITNQVFIGNDPGVQSIPVPPLGSISIGDARKDIWISTGGVAITVQGLLFPSGTQWTPSPAQVAAQINALGLAKETTQLTGNTNIAQVNTTLGTPPQKSDVNQVNTTLGVPSQSQDVKNLTTGGNPGGIPVLRGTDNLGMASAQTIAAGTNATLISAVAISKPGFEGIFQLNLPAAAGTVPFAALQMQWQDSGTGLLVGQKYYELTAGNGPANVITCYLSGPCRGNQITLKLLNRDPAQTLTVTWALNQTSHLYTIDRLLQPTYAATAPITYANPGGDPKKGLLASVTAVIGFGASITRLLAASNAKVKIMLDNTVQPNAAALQINTPSALAAIYSEAGAPTSLFRTVAAIGGQAGGEWQLPNGPTQVQIFNQGGAGNITPNVTITTMEY